MKRGWQWPVLVTLALGFTVGVNFVMLYAAKADPNGTVVEPDYYRKAVEWDRTMARRASSDSLGWTSRGTLSARTLQVQLADAQGQPITDAELSAVMIHNLDASTPLRFSLAARGDGKYDADVAARSGRWELRVVARRGTERFESVQHIEAP